jgi:uncharacterized LabA/DUF88 family protein
VITNGDEYSKLKPVADWLSYNHFVVTAKQARETIDPNGSKRARGDVKVEVTVDMIELASHLDQIVLIAGSGDFRRAIEMVQRLGVITTLISTIDGPAGCSVDDELRRQVDHFVDLKEMRPHIEKLTQRPATAHYMGEAA